MSAVAELNPRLLAVTEAGVSVRLNQICRSMIEGDLETLRSHGLGAERAELEGDPVAAVRTLTARIKAILEGS